MTRSADVVVENLISGNNVLRVVRDDLLPGGTKERAILPFLKQLKESEKSEFIYASPFSGFAQIALAAACHQLGLRCTLFCEFDQSIAHSERAHEFTVRAQSYGARVTLAHDLRRCDEMASAYEALHPASFQLPLGFDCPGFRGHLESALLVQWKKIEMSSIDPVNALWIPFGSGTLLQAFRAIVPPALLINYVDVHVLDEKDARVVNARKLGNVRRYSAPERFIESVLKPPPVPSNRFYDAKIWRFFEAHGQTGDLWWNVA